MLINKAIFKRTIIFLVVVLILLISSILVTYCSLSTIDLGRFEQRSPEVTDRHGKLLHVLLSADHSYRLQTRPKDVDPKYIESLIDIEDRYFYQHFGVNPLSLIRAGIQWFTHGKIISGGSTITMQVARLLNPKPRTLKNKWFEIVRALELECHYTKDEILTMYMTMLPMGGNLESIRVASLRYWGREPSYLSLAEISLLLSVPQNPEIRRPDLHPESCLRATQRVARRLINDSIFPKSDIDETDQLPFTHLHLMPRQVWHLARRLIVDSISKENSVQTTIDQRLQNVVTERARQFNRQLLKGQNIAALIVDATRGDVLAYFGSLGLDSPAGYMDLTRVVRSPGSTLKPFIYGMAFDDMLITDQTVLIDRPRNFGNYVPKNFDHEFRGPIRAGTALQQSLNIPAVEVMSMLGPDTFEKAWEYAGLRLVLPTGANVNLGVALGAAGVRLWDLVTAYTSLANNGRVQPLKTILKQPQQQSRLLLTSASAHLLTQILASASAIEGRTERERTNQTLAAFKTGTSYGFRDTWAVGVKGRYVVGIWVGRPDAVPVVGNTGRKIALKLATDIADNLHVDKDISLWNPQPILASDLHMVPFEIVSPKDGVQLVLQERAGLHRQLKVEYSGNHEGVTLKLNDDVVSISESPDILLNIPHNGFYELEAISPRGRIQTINFGVFSSDAD